MARVLFFLALLIAAASAFVAPAQRSAREWIVIDVASRRSWIDDKCYPVYFVVVLEASRVV